MSIRKKTLKISSIFAAGILGASTFALSSCSTLASESDTLITYNPTDVLASNNSPLNASFTFGTVSSYAKCEMLNLLDYQTTGQFNFASGKQTTTHDFMELSGASAMIVFKDEQSMQTFDTHISNISDIRIAGSQDDILNYIENKDNKNIGGLTEGTDYWIFFRDQGAIKYQNGVGYGPINPIGSDDIDNSPTTYYNDAATNGSCYQFIIDTNNQWVDSNGVTHGSVSSKDFERAIEAYYLSSELAYNRNGYFLDLLGIDYLHTLLDTSKTSSAPNYSNLVTIPDYDINYASNNDAVFTLYLDAPYVYTTDLLTKDYFAALPHDNQKVKNITLAGSTVSSVSGSTTTYKSNQSPIVFTSSSGNYSIDQTNTNWNAIFGSGGEPYFMQDTWFAGAYYISDFSTSKIIFKLNNSNLNSVGKYLLDYVTAYGYSQQDDQQRKDLLNKRIKSITYVYGSGTADTYYQMFKSNQLSYDSGVPDSDKSEAVQMFGKSGELVPIKTVKTSQSNYIVYTPVPYVLDSNGNVQVNSYISSNFAKFDYDWTSKDSMIIRAAISGLINHYQLSIINLPGSGDFQLSAIPFGDFSNYYQSISNDELIGGLPRQYSDYTNSQSYILGDFTIPYYSFSSSGISEENITVSKDTLQQALKDYGATTSNPLVFSYKMGEGSISNNYQSYLNTLVQQIDAISGGLISFKINQRNGSNPSFTEWYGQQESPLGFSYWSPDYNGVGTWIEADTTLQNNSQYEAIPSTNAHNSFLTFLDALVAVVKLTGATYGSTGYVLPTSISGDPFANDVRIQQDFNPNSKFFDGYDWTGDDINPTDSPGIVYSKLAIGLLNVLINEGVFNQSAFQSYVDNPSKLSLDNKTPTNGDDVYLGHDVINTGESADFSKWIGIYAGESTAKGLFESFVLDSDYSFVPRSEPGLNEFIYTLVSKQFQARASSVTPINFRDFSKQ